MSTQELDNIFKEGLEGFENPYREGAWEGAEALLKPRRRRWFLIWLLPLLFIPVLSGLYFINQSDKPESSELVSPINPESSSLDTESNSDSFKDQYKSEFSEAKERNSDKPNSKTKSPRIDRNSPKFVRTSRVGATASLANVSRPLDENEPQDLGEGATTFSGLSILGFIQMEVREAGPIPNHLSGEQKSDLDISTSWRKGWGIDVFAGVPLTPNSGAEEGQRQLFPVYAGAEVVYRPKMRWAFSAGLMYELFTISPQTSTIEQRVYGFGVQSQQYEITPSNLSYLTVPITARYHIFPRTRLSLGLQYSRLMQVYSYQQFSDGSESEDSFEEGYTSGFNDNQFSTVIGLGQMLSPRLRLDVQGRIGLTPMRSENSGSADQLQIKIGLNYSLWRQ